MRQTQLQTDPMLVELEPWRPDVPRSPRVTERDETEQDSALPIRPDQTSPESSSVVGLSHESRMEVVSTASQVPRRTKTGGEVPTAKYPVLAAQYRAV